MIDLYKEEDMEMIKKYPQWFYKTRSGDIFPYYKEDIERSVDPYTPTTFLPLLEAMDYPFLEEVWLRKLEHYMENGRYDKVFFGRYLATMKLKSFQHFTFKDSIYTEGIAKYSPKITWEHFPIDKDRYQYYNTLWENKYGAN